MIADFEQTEAMLRHFISKVGRRNVLRMTVVVGIPSGVTEVEKRAVIDATRNAGAHQAYVIEEPMAAAFGAGLPVDEPSGSMIVDIGGGTTEVAVISLGGIVHSRSIRVAGDEFDEAISAYVRRAYNLTIGDRTAEMTKIEVGSAYPLEQERADHDQGARSRDRPSPERRRISSDEVRMAIQEPLKAIVEAVKLTLEATPPELAADADGPRHRPRGRRRAPARTRPADRGGDPDAGLHRQGSLELRRHRHGHGRRDVAREPLIRKMLERSSRA